jgi:hypothetical protein
MVPVSAGSPVVVGVDGSPYAVDAARVGVVDAQPSGAAGGARWSSAVMLESRAEAPGVEGVEVVERVVVGEPAAVLIGSPGTPARWCWPLAAWTTRSVICWVDCVARGTARWLSDRGDPHLDGG